MHEKPISTAADSAEKKRCTTEAEAALGTMYRVVFRMEAAELEIEWKARVHTTECVYKTSADTLRTFSLTQTQFLLIH